MSLPPGIGQSSRRFSHACRHKPAVTRVEWIGCQGPVAVGGLRVALADHQLVVAGGRIALAGEQQPVVGGEDDLGGGADGATLGEVAAEGAAPDGRGPPGSGGRRPATGCR
jgi:hypothetical protein